MAVQDRNILKEYFNTGDRPTEGNFEDLIDSFLNLNEDSFVDSLPDASTSQKGIAQQATDTEASTGTNDSKYVTPKGVQASINALLTSQDSGWQVPTLENNFQAYHADYQALRYRKKNGIVYIEGAVKDGSDGKIVFNLPDGYKPSKNLIFTNLKNSGSSGDEVTRVDVGSDGSVTISAVGTTFTNLTGISFFVD